MDSSKKNNLGRFLAAAPVLMLFMSAYFKFFPNQEALEGMAKSGIPAHVVAPIGIAEILSTILFIIPRTSILGAILLTGYLGGAIFAHARMEEPFIMPLVFGVLIWGSLYLRDERISNLIPLKK